MRMGVCSQLDVCPGRGMMVTNIFFQHKVTHRHSWKVERGRGYEREVRKALLHYLGVVGRIRGQTMHARVFRGVAYGLSNHYEVCVIKSGSRKGR